MNIIITGSTGTLGSKVLHELLEQRFSEIKRIYLLVRKNKETSAEERISRMLKSPSAPGFIQEEFKGIWNKITVIDADQLLHPKQFLSANEKYYFLHSAGYVNLSLNPKFKEEIFEENFTLTKEIFEAYTPYLQKFIYISTAFAIGNTDSYIGNDYLNSSKNNFRNNYEASKFASEQFLNKAAADANIALQILRPSVLGGNIFDTPFFISKYMVYYLFAKFFHSVSSEHPVRIQAKKENGLNIIPVDYAAKVIAKVIDSDIKQLNIVHSQATPMMSGITKILKTVGFTNFKFTEEMLSQAADFESKLEKIYYQSIGNHLGPYFNSKPQQWDTSLLEKILPIPAYDVEEYLINTVEYAASHHFRNQKW